jgi:transposase InsO family protein
MSGFYLYLKEKDKRKLKDEKDYLLIKEIFLEKKKKIGAKRIKMILKDKYGIVMNLKKIRRIMNKYDLVCEIRRVNKSRVALMKNRKNMEVDNLLKRRFRQITPYRFLVTDITYLKIKNNQFVFLSVIKDLASGEILVYELSKFMDLDLVLNTIDNLEAYFKVRKLDLKNILLHSDQGFQYTNIIYHKKLKELGITQSMSRKGNSIDNASVESFFGHMKDEIDIKDLSFKELQFLINDYVIEYNYKRSQ